MSTLAVIVGNRGFFPSELCEEGRTQILNVLQEEGFNVVSLSPETTPYGTVESYEDAKKCAALFKENAEKIDGILVTLPNFGDERGIADALRLADLNLPVLVHAFPDKIGEMTVDKRRDSFCGKMSDCNNLQQYDIPYSLTELHTVNPQSAEFRRDLQKFAGVCRVVKGLRRARFGQIGARPAAFNTVRYSEKLLEQTGISVETIDLSEVFGRAWRLEERNPLVKAKVEAIKGYLNTRNVEDESLVKMARFAVVMDELVREREWVGTELSPTRAWWLRVPAMLLSPRSVFFALREEDEDDVAARSEPLLLVIRLAGIAAVLATPTASGLLDDPDYDSMLIAIWAFVAGGLYGVAGYFDP
jgi:L-fucose isomerase-like protein